MWLPFTAIGTLCSSVDSLLVTINLVMETLVDRPRRIVHWITLYLGPLSSDSRWGKVCSIISKLAFTSHVLHVYLRNNFLSNLYGTPTPTPSTSFTCSVHLSSKIEPYRSKRTGAMQHPCLSLCWSLLAVYHLTESEPVYPHKRTGWVTVWSSALLANINQSSSPSRGALIIFLVACFCVLSQPLWLHMLEYCCPLTHLIYVHWCDQFCATSIIYILVT